MFVFDVLFIGFLKFEGIGTLRATVSMPSERYYENLKEFSSWLWTLTEACGLCSWQPVHHAVSAVGTRDYCCSRYVPGRPPL